MNTINIHNSKQETYFQVNNYINVNPLKKSHLKTQILEYNFLSAILKRNAIFAASISIFSRRVRTSESRAFRIWSCLWLGVKERKRKERDGGWDETYAISSNSVQVLIDLSSLAPLSNSPANSVNHAVCFSLSLSWILSPKYHISPFSRMVSNDSEVSTIAARYDETLE